MSNKKGSASEPLTPNEASEAVIAACISGLTPFLVGAPGIGKTEIVRKTAKVLGVDLITILLAQREPVDFMGIPHVEGPDGEKRTSFAPPSEIPTDRPVLIFLDEFAQAALETQRAASEIILDRKFGGVPIHPDSYVVCASNRKEDRAGTAEILGHNKSRLITMYVAPKVSDWINWASSPEGNIHPSIIAFIQDKQIEGLAPKIDHSQVSYPCPRTWHMVSKAVTKHEEGKFKLSALTPVVIGAVGERMGSEFLNYLAQQARLPDPAQIVANPKSAPIPATAEEQLQMAKSIMAKYPDICKRGNRMQFMTYLSRYGLETLISAHNSLTPVQKKNAELTEDLMQIKREAEQRAMA